MMQEGSTPLTQERPHVHFDDAMEFLAPRQVQCPYCQVLLALPGELRGTVVRCGGCHQRFRLPDRICHSDAEVVSWLTEDAEQQEPEEHDLQQVYPGRFQRPGRSAMPSPAAAEPAEPGPQADAEPAPAKAPSPPGEGNSHVRLAKIAKGGALLEFSARRLEDRAFRSAMPRHCTQCGGRTHLDAHVIVFAPTFQESISCQAEHAAGKMVLTSAEVRDLSAEGLLDRLPRVPNVPHPADLPMPYWLCDMCKTSKCVSGRIDINSQTGEGTCQLMIGNLRRAEEFLANVGERGTESFRQLCQAAAETAERPWDNLPIDVQNRIQQWYRPEDGEQFLAYVPDRDLNRTEDGMAGFVLSTNRLIYHTKMRHKESPTDEPVQLALKMSQQRGQVEVQTPDWTVRQFHIDKAGLALLRRGLAKGRYRATWR